LICAKKFKEEFILIPLSCIFPKDCLADSVYEAKLGEFKYTYILAYDIKNEVLINLATSGGAQIRTLLVNINKKNVFVKGKYSKWYPDRILTCGALEEISNKRYLYLYNAISDLIKDKVIYSWLSHTCFFMSISNKNTKSRLSKRTALYNFNSFIINPFTSEPDVAAFVLASTELSLFEGYEGANAIINVVACKFNSLSSLECIPLRILARLPKKANVIVNKPVLILLRYSPKCKHSSCLPEIIGNVELKQDSVSYYIFGKAFLITKIIKTLSQNFDVYVEKDQLKHVYENLANIAKSSILKNLKPLPFNEVINVVSQCHVITERGPNIAFADFNSYFNQKIARYNPRITIEEAPKVSEHETRLCIISSFIDHYKKGCLNAMLL